MPVERSGHRGWLPAPVDATDVKTKNGYFSESVEMNELGLFGVDFQHRMHKSNLVWTVTRVKCVFPVSGKGTGAVFTTIQRILNPPVTFSVNLTRFNV